MIIVHMVNTGDYSGAEKVVLNIIEACKGKNKIQFIYAGRKGRIESILKSKNISFYPLNASSITDIKKMCKKIKPDIVHAHDYTAALFSCLAIGKHIPVISHIHNNVPWLQTKSIKSLAFLLTIQKSKQVLLVSKSIENEFVYKNRLKSKSTVVGNPLCIKEFSKQRKKIVDLEYDIIFVGRLSEQKDPLRFICIMSDLKKRKDDVKAVMLGEGNKHAECCGKIKELDLDEVISMKGFVGKPADFYKRSKVLCLTSRWEGFGLVVFEALANGLPVVTTSVGGMVDLVTEKCGKLCHTDGEFETELMKLLTDENYYNEKSKQAYLRAEELNNSKEYMEKLLGIYLEVLGKKPKELD